MSRQGEEVMSEEVNRAGFHVTNVSICTRRNITEDVTLLTSHLLTFSP